MVGIDKPDKFQQMRDAIKRVGSVVFVCWEQRNAQSWSFQLEVRSTANRFNVEGNESGDTNVANLIKWLDKKLQAEKNN